MKIGLHIRNSGPFATRDIVRECAQIADANPAIDDLWVYDHIAIPPEDSEGSDGYYLDPLATLAFIAAVTERINIGTRVLILPYRAPLPTAKWIASIQALSGGRLQLGAGVGWMEAEFRALGIDRSKRGKITDETLAYINECFDAEGDEVTTNGQTFLFRPRPKKPPIYVGGQAPHALRRAIQYGDGWALPSGEPNDLRDPIAELKRLFEEAGKPAPEILAQVKTSVDELNNSNALDDRIKALDHVGVTRISLGISYQTVDEFRAITEQAASLT